ncbi:tRNA nucleotidyltransferase cca2 [Malania oleifera]|uniref:tRNA nucleotidyltransferase cca2 n=1 Tax=Malania oleifera TaxID=397392 RepID=UPI0025ADD30C|nr:tRNA nucleotidyltransferase cca2 [Malania oleifera]
MKIALKAHRLFPVCILPTQPLPLPFLLPTAPRSIKIKSSNPPKTPSASICFRAMASSPPLVAVKDKIDLTDTEKRIFDRLVGTLSHFNLQTQLRVAGGWVRDKLLGKECYDIDIAIDNMLGREFCEKVADYLSCIGEEKRGAGVVPRNPEQSKHLETATMRICDVCIDFVNLRSEDYSENSRIPSMRFGTAEEDAYRRDLTINSMFYNINTGSVEDLTGRGIADLKAGKIVTPLPPKDTFLDDPLRVLRAIRFGARFEFVLDEDLKEAAASDEVIAALAQKISRERIGHEIDLMISGNQPVKAMTYICDLKLFWAVFNLPPDFEPSASEGCDRICLAYMDALWNLIQLIGCSTFNDEQRRLALYAAVFLPFRETVYKDNKAKRIPIVNYIFRSSLKLKSSYAETVIAIHHASEKFISLIPCVESNEGIKGADVFWGREIFDVPDASKLRILAGLLLHEIKGFWRVALLVSTLLYPIGTDSSKDFSDSHFQLDRRREIFMNLENAIIKLGLEKVWEVKPLVNGKDIMSILQLKTGGPLVREWQKKLLNWQLAHPSGTAEECLNWMRETYSKRAKLE